MSDEKEVNDNSVLEKTKGLIAKVMDYSETRIWFRSLLYSVLGVLSFIGFFVFLDVIWAISMFIFGSTTLFWFVFWTMIVWAVVYAAIKFDINLI